jgi:DNA polymerase-1
MRRIAKTVNFGVLYGISPYGLSQGLQIDVEKAKEFIDNYFNDFAGVRKYLDKTIADARENGFVETLSGRRRYLPDIHSGMPQVKNAAERMAINMPCQGTAADIVKMAMIEIQGAISKEQLTGNKEQGAKLLLQVHDELVFEVPDKEVEKFSAKIKKIMENIFKLIVPLKVDIKVGDNWQEMK